MSRPTGTRLAAIGIASGGVLLSHWLTYLTQVPNAADRASVLGGTAHGYLSVAGELATVLVAVTVGAMFVGRIVAAGAGPTPGRSLAVRLAVLQSGTFLGMEVLERLLAGAPLDELRGTILPFGVAINIVVALLGAFLVRSVLRVADRVAAGVPGRTIRTPLRAVARVTSPAAGRMRRRPSLGPRAVRGPPTPASA